MKPCMHINNDGVQFSCIWVYVKLGVWNLLRITTEHFAK